MQAKSESKGFTLVEILVVIGLIGVIVAILLPAVQAARFITESVDAGNQSIGNIPRPGSIDGQPSPYGIWGAMGTKSAREQISINF